MQACDYENFDVTIRGEGIPYGVSARFLDQTADGFFEQEVTQSWWQSRLYEMRRTLYTPNPQPMLDGGHRLFTDLFRGDIRDLWVAARAGLERGTIQGLRLRLALQSPAVAALPWETLCDQPRNTIFAVSSRILLVRVEREYRRLSAPPPPAIRLPLRVLLVAPTDPTGVINAQREIDSARRMLLTLGRDQIKVHVMTGHFSIVDLRRRLEHVRPQILHVLAHGAPQGIQLWQNKRPRLVTPAAFRTTLERTPWVRLVFLNACLAGQNAATQPLSALGPQLLQAGVPAVIAMQFEIRDDVAADFAHFLYEALLTGSCPGAIDSAVTNARAGLYALDDDQVGYATPILWLNAPDGRLFKLNGSFRRDEAEDTDGDDANGDDDNGDDTDTENTDCENPDGENTDSENFGGNDDEDADTDPNGRDNDENGDDAPQTPPSAVDTIDLETEAAWLDELEQNVNTLRVGPELEFALRALREALQNLRDLLERLRNWDHTSRVQAYVDQTQAYRRQKAEALRLRRKLREAL